MLRLPIRARAARALDVNLTSMVDVVFLLIIFFMLVSSYISAENVEIDLPSPDRSLAEVVDLPERIVLNCRHVGGTGPTGSVLYQIGLSRVATVEDLEQHLRGLAADRRDVELVVRADRQIRYALIRSALQAVAQAGIERIRIAAEVEE